MFRECLRTRSARPSSRSTLGQTGHWRHVASTKPNTNHARPALSSRYSSYLRYPFATSRRDLNTTWPSTIKSLSKITALSFLFGHIFWSYVYQLSATGGISMLPTINSYGDWVLISKYYRRGRGIEVGDLVSYHHPVEPEVQAVKRVLGLEGDFVLRDSPGTSGKMIQVPQGHCWVVGDNVLWSQDSRHFGPLPMALVRGKVVARYTPWTTLNIIKNPFHGASRDQDGVD